MTADVEVFSPEGESAGEIVLPDGTTVVGFDEPLTTDEAKELTEHIRSATDVLYVLIGRAHAGKAWQALGYSTFAEYVREEFDMSRSRAYQILDQHKVIEAITEALPEGSARPKITEAQARDLKSVLDEVVPEVKRATAGLSEQDAQDITDDIVEDYREQARAAAAGPADEDGEGFQGNGGMPGQFGGGGGGQFNDFGDDPDDQSFDEGPQVDANEIRRRVQAAYDFYTATSALNTMPDVDVVLDTINEERIPQVREQLPVALAWLTEFNARWLERHPLDNSTDED